MNDDHDKKDLNGTNKKKEDKIIHFPTLAQRDRARKAEQKEKAKQEQQWRAQYKVQKHGEDPPFFNFGKIPPFTRALIIVFLLVHFPLHLLMDAGQTLQTFYTLGFVPAYFTGGIEPFPLYALLGPVTHMFVHGSWMHLFFNGVMALALGMFFEKTFGTKTAAIFFTLCGLAGALAFFAFDPFSTHPLIGASGSISGFFGALIMNMSRSGQMGAMGQGRMSKYGPWPIVLFWLAFMVIMGLISGGGMAWQAHVGGFLAGIGLLHLLQTGRIKF